MKKDNSVLKWIVIIILVVVLYGVSGVFSEILDINMRSARFLILTIIFFGWYIVDVIRNRKR